MDRNIYFFRHGETPWNAEKRCQGHSDTVLNSNGLLQSKRLAKILSPHGIQAIFSSDLKRAAQTAEILREDLRDYVPLILDARLRETNLGVAEGMLLEDVKSRFGPNFWDQLFVHGALSEQRFPGGESPQEVVARLLSFLEDVAAKTAYRSIAVATHGGVLRSLRTYACKGEQGLKVAITNCSIFHFTYHPHQKVLNFCDGPW